ncbi:hypothetical protein AB0C52_31205 [Streptomyces sp. NPDC048717]|uniref:hypothetical protein n=1 Tax=Streptomyces sp. NPDC048717 TaxID=3154928 RepID=UPI0034351353
MSGTETRPGRRGSLLVASVAAGVLLVGGGGVYYAATASGDGGGASDAGGTSRATSASGTSDPAAQGPPGQTGGPGIAPGEPAPGGAAGTVYRAEGTLPQGPSTAAVHRPEGRVTSAEVTRLARALDLGGTPRLAGGVWRVGPDKDGSGPRLSVAEQAPGSWTFHRYEGVAGGDNCLKGKACPPAGDALPPAGGAPASETAARAAVAPVLAAAGQDDAKSAEHQSARGAVRTVTVDPVVGGLPTYGWSTTVQVGPDGTLLNGSGRLKEPVKAETLPVLSAQRALDELNGITRGTAGPAGSAVSPASPASPTVSAAPSAAPSPRVVGVTSAVLGLAPQSGGGDALAPAWLFQVRDTPGAAPHTLVRPAVDNRRTTGSAPSAAPASPGGRQLSAYRTDAAGTRLSVTFWGGVCGTYTATADESAPGRVTVRVTERPQEPGRVCVMSAVETTKTVTLRQPLGDRTVVDGASGEPVPRG